MFNKALIVYFSGTGGVERVAATFEKELADRGLKSELQPLDCSSPVYKDINTFQSDADIIILLFAVHAFDAPAPVYKWIESTPVKNKKVAVISVSGGGEVWPNTGCRNACCKALEKKGFEVVYDRMMCMPSNWVSPINDHMAMHLINAVPVKVNHIVNDLTSGKTVRSHRKMTFLRSKITKLEKKSVNKFPEQIKVDGCKNCGLCAKRCPVGNIELKDGKIVFKDSCIMCFRCIYACPANALSSRNFMVLKKGFNLNEVEKRMQGVELEPIEKCCKGLAWSGVKKYLLSDD